MKKLLLILLSAGISISAAACAPTAQATPSSSDSSVQNSREADSQNSQAQVSGNSASEQTQPADSDYASMSEEYEAYRESAEADLESLRKYKEAAESSAAARKEAAERIGYETEITYSQLLHGSELFRGMKVQFSGKVLQVIQDSESIQLRLAVDGSLDTVVYGEYDTNVIPIRVSKDAQITIYGTSIGMFNYESTSGKDQSLPYISIENLKQ